jgi:hypothetical protein
MLHWKVLVRFTPDRLRGRQWKEHGRAIPAHILETVKFTSDRWNRSCDDGLTNVSVYENNNRIELNVRYLKRRGKC